MIEIMGMGENTKVTLPKSVVDPEKVKMGQTISPKITGKVCSISEQGVTIDITDSEDDDEYDDMEDGEEKSKKMSKKMKKQMGELEEYN